MSESGGRPEQTVTLEAWLPGWPSQVVHSTEGDLGRALVQVRQEMDPPHRGRQSQTAPALASPESTR